MSKTIEKSQKLVTKAVGVFSKALAEVEKANEMLQKSITVDTDKALDLQGQIDVLNNQIEQLTTDIAGKKAEIDNNLTVIASLRQFTKEA